MSSITVYTKEELQRAMDACATYIIVKGELAEKLQTTKRIATLGPVAIAALAAIGVAAVPTGGASLLGFLPVAALTGMEVAAIIVAVSLGVAMLIALYKNYEVKFKAGPDGVEAEFSRKN